MRRSILLLTVCLSIVVSEAVHAQTIREVTYNARAVTRVNAKLRFTTMIVLPEAEEILDFVCGDKDFWVISGAQNLAYVKPAKARPALTDLRESCSAASISPRSR